jgi:adenosine deaminase
MPNLELLHAFTHALPKVELHAHLLGTVRRETLTAMSERQGWPVSAEDIDTFYTRSARPVGAIRVLRALDAVLIRQPGDLYRLTYEYLQDAAAHHVHYAEFFWNPTGTARLSGIAYPQALAAIRRAIADAYQDHAITGRLIAAIDREAEVSAAQEMVEWVLAHRCDEVVGIGMDYREEQRPPELFVQPYATARKAGLKTTAHAGEFGCPWNNVQAAIDLLQVDRVDHGYTVLDNPELLRRCVDSGIVFTVVPSNSYYRRTLAPERWALDHPIRHMPAAGLRVHPNSDDPTLHFINPTEVWATMVSSFGFGLEDLRGFMLNGLDAAWIDEGTRRAWRSEAMARFDALRPLWPSPLHPSSTA